MPKKPYMSVTCIGIVQKITFTKDKNMNDCIEIYLPASAPDNLTYGTPPRTPYCPEHGLFNVFFEKEVWYSKEYRQKTLAQIEPELKKNTILIGFSKSGLGALAIAMDNPTLFYAVIIFDAPLMHIQQPPWNTSSFFTQPTWEKDLPQNRLEDLEKVSRHTTIMHIGGRNFIDDHEKFYAFTQEHGIQTHFLPRRSFPHHWESGWLSQAFESIPPPTSS